MLHLLIKEVSKARHGRALLFLLASCSLAGSLGCRSTTDNQIDLLERELRTQEDYIYELEDYLVEYSEKLRDARCACPPQTAGYTEQYEDVAPAPKYVPSKSRKQSAKQESSVVEPTEDDLPLPSEPEIEAPAEPDEFSPEELEVPEIDLEIEGVSNEEEVINPLRQKSRNRKRKQNNLVVIPDPVDYAVNENELPVDPPPADDLFEEEELEMTSAEEERSAERVEITQVFWGSDQNNPSLLTVIEALDENNEPVDLDGEVSLMVMGGDRGSLQRLKRWNFNAEETTAAWQSSDLGDGLHLELPLDDMELPAEPVELWVRLVTAEGRKLLTQLPVETTQLASIDTYEPPAAAEMGLVSVEMEAEAAELPQNTLSIPIEVPVAEQPELAQKPKPRWRASMQRTGHTTDGFATTSATAKGWIAQPLGRQQPSPPAKVASHNDPVPTKTKPAEKSTTAKWSSSRY